MSIYVQASTFSPFLTLLDIGGTFEDCIRISRRNLCDPTLPAYWTIKNLLNIAHATDDWEEAEICLSQCQQLYLVSKMRYDDKKDKVEGDKEGLEKLKRAIDELERLQQEDRRNMRSAEVIVPDEIEQKLLLDAIKEKAARLRHQLKREEDLGTRLGDLKIEQGGDEKDRAAEQKDDRGFLGEEYELYVYSRCC